MRLLGISILCVLLSNCGKELLPPTINLIIFPLVGDTTTLFELNASDSHDDRSYDIALQYRWDFDHDLVWDTEYSTDKIEFRKFEQPGQYIIAVEVRDLDGLTSISRDTLSSFGRNHDFGLMTDPRDDQAYKTVKLDGRWWMAENLRYGQNISQVTEQTNNQVVERYEISDTLYKGYTNSFYSWYEAMNWDPMNTQGICPDGWHIPTGFEWRSLYSTFPVIYSVQYYGKAGWSGFCLDDGAQLIRYKINEQVLSLRSWSGFWSSSSDPFVNDQLKTWELTFSDGMSYDFVISSPKYFNSEGIVIYNAVRCVKDLPGI